MTTEDLIRESLALSRDDRLKLIDSLMRSLNTPDPEIERRWIEVAQRRLAELESGDVSGIPGDLVLEKLRQRIARA